MHLAAHAVQSKITSLQLSIDAVKRGLTDMNKLSESLQAMVGDFLGRYSVHK